MDLLKVEDLTVAFQLGYQQITAVRQLSFSLNAGECLAIVGESGSGKSTTAKAVMGILGRNARVVSGRILFWGQDLLKMSRHEKRQIMGRDIAMVFQNPMTSLDPSYTVFHQIQEIYRTHLKSRGNYLEEIRQLLRKVEFPDPDSILNKYPHELSGGMRQRVAIAMAWALNPAVLIADEPTSALDVCTQAEILRLMKHMAKESGTAVILITHDLGVVAELADRVLVMYAGERMESQKVMDFFQSPKHPYSRGLLEARPQNFRHRFQVIPGNVQLLPDTHHQCPFYNRCRDRIPECENCRPQDTTIGQTGVVRCHLASSREGGI